MVFLRSSYSSGKLRMQKDKMGVHKLTDLKGSEGTVLLRLTMVLINVLLTHISLGWSFPSFVPLTWDYITSGFRQIDVDIEIDRYRQQLVLNKYDYDKDDVQRNNDFRTLLNNIQSRKETYKEWVILTLLLLHMFTLLEGTTNSFFCFFQIPSKRK